MAGLYTSEQQAQIALAERAPAGDDLLIALAKAYWRGGLTAQFADCFRRAYCLKPAMETLRKLYSPAEPQAHAMAQELSAHGAGFSPVIADLALAAARSGDAQTVRRLVDYDRFFREGHCAPPGGQDLDAFHDAVAAEIKSDLTFYGLRRSIHNGYRNDRAMRATSPALVALQGMLQGLFDDYIASLPDDPGHPFLAMRPASHVVDGWAVISTPQSYHNSHLHPVAWATGVYYVSEPAVSRSSESGWLEIGPPAGVDAAGWERRRVAPKRGSFVMMPAYFYHQTAPMGVDDERICIAFEAQYPQLRNRDAMS